MISAQAVPNLLELPRGTSGRLDPLFTGTRYPEPGRRPHFAGTHSTTCRRSSPSMLMQGLELIEFILRRQPETCTTFASLGAIRIAKNNDCDRAHFDVATSPAIKRMFRLYRESHDVWGQSLPHGVDSHTCAPSSLFLPVHLRPLCEVSANLRLFLRAPVRISPHDPTLSRRRAVLSGGEGEGRIWPCHGRFIRIDNPNSFDYTWASEGTKGVEVTVALSFEMKRDQTEVSLMHSNIPDDGLGLKHRKGGPECH
jgi:hypothetical protein